MTNEFDSKNNEKVITIGTHNGNIYAGENESNSKNISEIKIDGTNNGTITNTVSQGNKQSVWASVVVVAIVAIAGMFIFALSKQPETTNQNNTVNGSINSPKSATNLQTQTNASNTDIVANNPKRIAEEEKPKPTPIKKSITTVVTMPKITPSPNKVVPATPNESKSNSNAVPSNCSLTNEGCKK